MRLLSAPFVRGILGGVLGLALALLTWHIWTDHRAFHVMLDYLNTHAATINKLP